MLEAGSERFLHLWTQRTIENLARSEDAGAIRQYSRNLQLLHERGLRSLDVVELALSFLLSMRSGSKKTASQVMVGVAELITFVSRYAGESHSNKLAQLARFNHLFYQTDKEFRRLIFLRLEKVGCVHDLDQLNHVDQRTLSEGEQKALIGAQIACRRNHPHLELVGGMVGNVRLVSKIEQVEIADAGSS